MTTSTLTITEFLLACIAEDETEARDCKEWSDCFACPAHEQFDTARILAECEAKRRIVEEHPDYGGYGESCATCAESDIDLTPWPCPTLRALAAIYADHAEYREEWRP